jgi:hypothetical protein
VRRRPADTQKRARRPSWAEPDEPVTAILCRSENSLGAAECTKRSGYVSGSYIGNVAADEDCSSMSGKCSLHPGTQVSCPLWAMREGPWPAGPVGRGDDFRPPARVLAEVSDEVPQSRPMEAQSRHCTDLCREPPLYSSKPGRPNE